MDNYIKKIKNKNIHIVGAFGAEGSAVLEFLAKKGIKNITAHDFSTDKDELRRNFSKTHLWVKKKTERLAKFENLLKLPAKLNLKNEYLEGVLKADIIFAPSSWHLYKPNFPILQKAKEKEIEFSSLTKLYFELAKGKIISVTGTKGKGATSRLIYDILAGADKKHAVYLAGNDRRAGQELDKISQMNKNDILVLETSNRQLMNGLGKSPDIGVITNISPDHIDEHGSFEKYIEVKKSLFRYSKKSLPAGRQGNIAILNYDNEITKIFGNDLAKQGVKVFFFSRKSEVKSGAFAENGKIYVQGNGIFKPEKEEICGLKDIKLIGEHNIENILAAVLTGYLAGAKPEEIKKSIQKFRGLPHRIEFIGEYDGARFYDDLASTNPDSTIAAIRALKNQESRIMNHGEKLILVCGGDDKGMNYKWLAREINDKADILILLPGTGTNALKAQFSIFNFQFSSKSQILNLKENNCHPERSEGSLANASSLNVLECSDFSEAIDLIKKQTKTGDIVLISPASAHFQARYIDVLKKPIRNIIVEKFNLSS